ncbi:ABC transporter substrate-binding protein [Psychromonas aquimarina]|uniref:ABC transporter substrate-binding protein n=1 Tax=Psychromonas aquimarina TaxID=444919 RepID=UPI0003FDC025|nr:sugar ABC transporter [Psychromonas aquimarina]
MKTSINAWLCLLLLCLPLHLSARQKVLIIESYHSEYEWDQSYIKGIKSVLLDDFELSYFQMNTKRLPKDSYPQRADKAWQYFQKVQPDLVILGDDNALNYLGRRFSKTSTPVIYLGINNNPRHYHVHRSKNISGVLERPLIKRAIPTVTQLLAQDTKSILLMFDNSLTAHTILEEIFSSNTQIKISGIKVDIRLIGEWEVWKTRLLTASESSYDAVFLGLFHTLKDKNGRHVPAEQVLQWSAQNSPVPPFAFWDFAVGEDKAIGGLVLFGYEQGKLAAEMAREVLTTGIQPYRLGTKTAEKGRYLFSSSQLQKYGITLPEKLSAKVMLVE